MADEPNTYDTGEPRFGNPIWRGRYSLSPSEGVTISNDRVMLSKQNMVQFMGDADGVIENQTFATLPEECCPDETVMLPVVVEGASGIEQQVNVTATGGSISVPIPALGGSADVPESTADVAIPSLTGSAIVPGATAPVQIPVLSGTASVPGSRAEVQIPNLTGTSSFDVSASVPDIVSVGYDESGVPNSAFSFGIINNSTEPVKTEVTVNGTTTTVDIPSSLASVSTNASTAQASVPTATATVTTDTSEASVTIPGSTVPVSTNPTIVTVESPTIKATGTVTIPQSIGILIVSPNGKLSCNLSGKVHLNGLNFHTCANYY